MTCLRCEGYLRQEYWQEMEVVLTRCLNCGDVTDEVILVNRRVSLPPASFVADQLLASLRGSTA